MSESETATLTETAENDAHRFGQTWRAEDGLIFERWCVDCAAWVEVEPIPIAESAAFPRERARVIPPEGGADA